MRQKLCHNVSHIQKSTKIVFCIPAKADEEKAAAAKTAFLTNMVELDQRTMEPEISLYARDLS
jgi:hypothetical protein